MAVLGLGLAIVGGLFCVTIAGIKNRDLATWFLLGAAVPIVSAVIVCLAPPLDSDGRPVRS